MIYVAPNTTFCENTPARNNPLTGRKLSWKDVLNGAGFDSYAEYLNSETWANFRQKFLSRSENRVCRICGRSPVDVHHKIYKRLGKEQFGDVVSLCREHHGLLHKKLKNSRLGLKRLTREFVKFSRKNHQRKFPVPPSYPRASSRLPALNRQGPLVAVIPAPSLKREPQVRNASMSSLDRQWQAVVPAKSDKHAQAGARSDGSPQLSPQISLTGGI